MIDVAKRLAPKEKALRDRTERLFTEQGILFLRSLSRQLEAGVMQEALSPLDIVALFDVATGRATDSYAKFLNTTIRAVVSLGAQDAIKQYKLGVSFTLRNPLAVAFLKDRAAERITMINDTTKQAIRGIVTEGARVGDSPQQIAKNIKDRFTEFTSPPKRGPSHIRSRAELVAVTEVGDGYQAGNYLAIKSTGLEFEKSWLTVGDDRVSRGCKDNAGAGWIGLEEEFPTGDQRPPRFPGDRCSLMYRPKEGD